MLARGYFGYLCHQAKQQASQLAEQKNDVTEASRFKFPTGRFVEHSGND